MPPYENDCLEYESIPRNIQWNIKICKMEYSRKRGQQHETRFFRNLEYSKNTTQQRCLIFFGIWNILATKIFFFKHVIFRNILEMFRIWTIPKNNENFWNMQNISIQKKSESVKKKWNMVSNIQKKYHNAWGR